jgi:flagellar hook-basal body complex protein FliE
MIDPISSIGAPFVEGIGPTMETQKSGADFSNWLIQQANDLDTKLADADMQVRQLAVGDNTNIHQVMMSLEKARLSLELVVQVRNKVLEGYQSLMQMQV